MMANNNNVTNQTDAPRIIYIKISGICEKLYELLDLAQLTKTDTIIINETKLSAKDWLSAKGYTVYRRDRHGGLIASGGTAILISKQN